MADMVSRRVISRPVDGSRSRDPGRLAVRLDNLRFLVFGRSLPAVLFALLGYRVLMNLVGQVRSLPAHLSPADVAAPLATALYFLFCTIPVAIYLTRARPQARDGRVVARVVALVGTTMLLIVGVFSTPVIWTPPPAVQVAAATPLTIVAFAVAVYGLLSLRRSLSIIPEARRLVVSGPYRLIRHPLYAAEMLAATAIVLARPTLWAIVTLPAFYAVQLVRAHFEERLLTRTFPDYVMYRRRTKRLIPKVW